MKGPRWFTALRNWPEFRKVWGAHLVSSLGSGVAGVAVPLLAVLALDASPVEVGLLTALTALPHVLFSLFAGVLIDRLPQRRLLMATDFGRAAVLAVVPVLGLLDLLSMTVLYCVVFIVQSQSVVNDLASLSVVPKVLPPDQLGAGNSAMSVNLSMSSTVGHAVGGALVQAVGAVFAVALNAVSYVASGLLLKQLRAPAVIAGRVSGRKGVVDDIKSGLTFVWNDRVLVALCLSSAIGAFAISMREASLILAMVREYHFSPALVGALAMLAGLGGISGGMIADWATTRFGFGRAVIVAILITAGSIALLSGPFGTATAVVIGTGQFLGGLSGAVYSVGQLTMRQLATPPEMLGRVNAVRRFLVYAALPVGGIVGGTGGAAFGSQSVLLIAAIVMAVSALPLILGRISRVFIPISAG